MAGADLQCDGKIVGKGHRIGFIAEDFAAILGHGDEGSLVALLGQPVEVSQVFGLDGLHTGAQGRHFTSCFGFSVDLLGSAVFGDHIEKIKKFFKQFENMDKLDKSLIFSRESVKSLAREYFDLEEMRVPNVFEEMSLSKSQFSNFANPMNARMLASGVKGSKMKLDDIQDYLCDMEIAKIETEQRALVKKRESGKESFEKSFRKLAMLGSIKKTFEKTKKSAKKIEIDGLLTDSLEYSIYSETMFSYFVLSLAIMCGVLFGSIAYQCSLYPFLSLALMSYAVLLAVACLILLIIFIKQIRR